MESSSLGTFLEGVPSQIGWHSYSGIRLSFIDLTSKTHGVGTDNKSVVALSDRDPDGSKGSDLVDIDGPRGIPIDGIESCRIR